MPIFDELQLRLVKWWWLLFLIFHVLVGLQIEKNLHLKQQQGSDQ